MSTSGNEGSFLMENPAFLKIFGFKSKEKLQKLMEIDPYAMPDDRKASSDHLKRRGKVSGIEVKLKNKDGTPCCSVMASCVYDENENVAYYDCTIDDISCHNKAEEESKARDALLKKLSDRVPGVIYQFQLFPDGRSCLPYASDGIGDIFEVTPEEVREDVTAILQRLHQDDYEEVKKSILESFNTLQPWEYSFRVILPKGGERWLNGRAVSEKLDDGSVLWHGFIADITKQKRAEEEICSRNEALTALNTLSIHMRQAKGTTDLLPIVLGKAQSLLQTENGMVILLLPDRKHFTIAFGNGHWRDMVGRTFPFEEGLSGNVLHIEKTYVSTNYSVEPHALPITDAAEIGPIMIVPMFSEKVLIGALAVSRSLTPESRSFTSAEVRLIETIGEMAGNALCRQRLHEDAQRRLRQTQALRNIDMAITGSIDLRVTYNVILDEITRQLNIDAAAIVKLESHTMMLNYEVWRGFYTTDPASFRLHMGEGYTGRTALNKQTCFISDLSKSVLDSAQGRWFSDEGFCTYYAVPLISKGYIQGVLEVFHRKKFDADEEWISFLDVLASQTAIAIDNATLFHNLERANIELVQSYDATIEGWAYALDLRDEATEGHSQRVTKMTLDLSQQMDITEKSLAYIRRGALLHDIGKMGIPDCILLKPGKLTEEEWVIMRRHPEYAYKMLSSVEYLRPALDIPYCHHEKWDGTGYPRGLKSKEIPLAARIFAVVDTYDALISERPYREAWLKEKALAYIQAQSGRHFDPLVVEMFMKKMALGW
ncbi:MAG: HD domain-containing phosphohydrolase [Bacillota bacterium]